MYVNFADVIVRQYQSEFPAEDETPATVLVTRALPESDSLAVEDVTQDVRRWLLDGRHTRFLFEERRRYADVGAEGASVTFILNLLGSAAASVAIEQILDYVKSRIGGSDDRQWLQDRFDAASIAELRGRSVVGRRASARSTPWQPASARFRARALRGSATCPVASWRRLQDHEARRSVAEGSTTRYRRTSEFLIAIRRGASGLRTPARPRFSWLELVNQGWAAGKLQS